jgi:hypothetical protein
MDAKPLEDLVNSLEKAASGDASLNTENRCGRSMDRNSEKRGRKKKEQLELGAAMLKMRVAGHSPFEISKRFGVSTGKAVKTMNYALVKSAQASLSKVEASRGLLMQRLDSLLESVWPDAVSGSIDHVATALAIIKQQSKLSGVESVKHEHTGNVTITPVVDNPLSGSMTVEQWEQYYSAAARLRARETLALMGTDKQAEKPIDADYVTVDGQDRPSEDQDQPKTEKQSP